MRSAWRGEPEARSMPQREKSWRGSPTAISSMLQHASPKVAGHTEARRTAPKSCSTVVRITPLGSFSSSPIPALPYLSVPLETTAPPDIGVRDEDGDDEQDHFHET